MRFVITIFSFLILSAIGRAQTCAALFSFDGTPITIHFQDLSTHAPNDPIVSWDWDFDDGSSSSQQNPIHTFPEADRYDVVLTIQTQNGCISTVEVRIEICDFDVDYTVGTCNANNLVPVNISIVDIYNNAEEIDVILDGQSVPGSPFQISGGNPVNINVLVPGNGLSHTINIQSTDIETCGRTIDFVTEDCSSDCFLGALNVSVSGGITHNVIVGDDFFSPQTVAIDLGDVVHFTWQGSGHSTTSDATSGPDSWNSGVIGGGSTFDVHITNPGTHRYYCQPHGAPNGVGMSGQILSNCPGGTSMPLTVEFNATMTNAAGYQILWDNIPVVGSPFSYTGTGPQQQVIEIAGDGLPHTLIVRDVADPTCDVELNYNAPDCGQGGGNPVCSITLSAAVTGGCTNNEVPVTLTVNATNNSASFHVTVDGNAAGTFAYNAGPYLINVPGDGNAHSIVVTDGVDGACTASTSVTTPNCTLPCSITNLQATVAGGSSGPSGIEHIVYVEDFQFNPNVINITVGDMVKWQWTGSIPHTSTSDATGTPNSWDSGLLGNGATYLSPLLSEGEHNYYCIPHGAPGGVGMAGSIHVLPPCNSLGQATVQVNFQVTSGQNGEYRVLVDGSSAGIFPYVPGAAQSASVFVAGDGLVHQIVVQDVAETTCNANTAVTTFDCGGTQPVCMISLAPSISGGCTNGQVPVQLNVTGTNHAVSYVATVDGQPAGTFTYGQTATVQITGDGMAHTIMITDANDPGCTAIAAITTTNCSLPCQLTISEISFGQNTTHTVQVQEFQYAPEEVTINLGDTISFVWTGVIPHTVTSDATSGPNSFNSGLLSQGAIWNYVPTATGSFPYYCIPHGAPGGVGMSGIIHVSSTCEGASANGTVSLQYTGASGQGFNISDNGTAVPGSPFAYSPSGNLTIPLTVAGDGSLHTIVVTDAGNTGCSAQQSVIVPDCNASSCSLSLTQVSVSACEGNTVTLSVQFTSDQISSGYNVYKDGLKLNATPLTTDASGNGNYTTLIVGNGSVANINVQFISNATCSATQQVNVISCAGPCLIDDMVVGLKLHRVEVKDFEFSPSVLEVLTGDTIRFQWTGVIPHTTTSDQLSGPNTWNSGLLGQGATYDVIVRESGSYPYYCQPHGGPGGIGMSGVIHVIDTCALETWKVNLSFSVSAGSPLGYNVFVDGVKVTDAPILYDDPVGINTSIIDLPGDGSWHNVTIQDLETGFCAFTQPVKSSICGAGCTVVNLTANTGANIIHTIEVRDFDYVPANITVGAGETIRFIWTGEIPHTVTSDALSGPEVFNSGLLGQGATYDLVINTPGVHPYFCIPHGGPNGIGMSGNITVLPACADNMEHVQVNFDVTNGSLLGYQVFVDGVLYGNNPHPYDARRGSNHITLNYPADNSQHIITVQDMENNICAASEFFTTGSCNADCEITGLDYFLGNGRRHQVLVRDFDYEPANLQIELGDTVHFVWTGAIPHTATSDQVTGTDSFNSGLLGTGSEYFVVLTQTGMHPYYCIPHGAPGGIGMAGNIEVIDACNDGNVFVDFRFFSTGTGVSYDVTNNDVVVINDRGYVQGGVQSFSLELEAQGNTHHIKVSDNGPDECMMAIVLDSFDCNDPCFLVRADFGYDINFSTREVAFSDKSKGNIVSWEWHFGDGSTSNLSNPVHTYPEAILYNVCLTVTDVNGCSETYCDKLRLGADVCNAGFSWEQNGLEFKFTNTSDVSADVVTASWSFGDGSTSSIYEGVSHVYASGLYEVCLNVTSPGCSDTYCEILDLTDPCLALSSKYQANTGDDPLHYVFTDHSTGAVGSRIWGFGDGQISMETNPTHTYQAIGAYTVCLLVIDNEGNCTDSDCRTLYVGTTGTVPTEMKLKKMVVFPNPVSISTPAIMLRGFESNEINHDASIVVYDSNGTVISSTKSVLVENHQVILPGIPGVYYIQVVTGKNKYGTMITIQ